jgi:hypothetical protein
MGRVFILGAGASSFAGYPLGRGLWAFIRDHRMGDATGEERRRVVTEEMNRVFTVFPPDEYDQPDLEGLFTLFDLTVLLPGHIEVLHSDWKSLTTNVLGTIIDAFLSYQHDLGRHLSGTINLELPLSITELNHVIKAWPAKLEQGDTIISFNWDLLHEATLYEAGKWTLSDGYGFTCRDESQAQPSPVKLLKLHGSINWAQDSARGSDPAILHRAQFFRGASHESPEEYMKELGWDLGRRLVIPTYIKTVDDACLFRIWNQAATALRAATEITIIGYSLQPADTLARYLLGTSFAQNEQKPPIQVVSSGPDYWEEFSSRLGLKLTRIRKKFEQWVLDPDPTQT